MKLRNILTNTARTAVLFSMAAIIRFGFADVEVFITDREANIPSDIVRCLNEQAVREGDRIKVSGTPGYWNSAQVENQGDYTRSREAAFDGRDDTFFDPLTKYNVLGDCWTGIEFTSPKVVTKIRYKGRSDGATLGQLQQLTGCVFEGANSEDWSDAEIIAVGDIDKDKRPPEDNPQLTWNGYNYWCEIDLPFTYNATNTLATVVRNRKAYRYLRIRGPNPYVQSGSSNGQNGMCCGNVSELEFWGVDVSVPSRLVEYDNGSYTPQVLNRQEINGKFTFEIFFPVPPVEDSGAGATATDFFAGKHDYLYGYELVRQTKYRDGTITNEFVNSDFMIAIDGGTTKSFVETQYGANIRYFVRGVSLCTMTDFTMVNTPMLTDCPQNLAVTPQSGGHAIITWENTGITEDEAKGIVILRGTAPGGPWTNLNSEPLSLTTTQFTDDNAGAGILYYYKAYYLLWDYAADDHTATVAGEETPVIECSMIAPIERVWTGDTSRLKDGMRAICHYQPWDYNSGKPDNLFDNDFTTFSDIVPKENKSIRDDGTAKAGVDLGQAYVIKMARIYPRQNVSSESEKKRFSKLALFGSNADSTDVLSAPDGWRDDANLTKLTERFQDPVPYNSFYEVAVTNPTPFRYVLIKHADFTASEKNFEAFANAAELQLYGYLAGDAGDSAIVLIAPLNVHRTRTDDGNSVEIDFTWNDSPNEEWYRVERRADASDDWVVITNLPANTTSYHYADTFPDGVPNAYFRIASVRNNPSGDGEEVAYSYSMQPLRHGGGTGLHAVYIYPYEENIMLGKEYVPSNVSNVDYDWGSLPLIENVPDSTNDVGVIWSGKLIVPIAGEYTFRLESDGGVALRIGKKQVVGDWGGNDQVNEHPIGKIQLDAGEVDIRLDYHTHSRRGANNDTYCRLYWHSNHVPEEIIPASQLIPAAIPPMGYPWMGERTFYSTLKGYCDYTPTRDDHGDIVDGFYIMGGGGDIWLLQDTMHWVWRLVTGDFSISAKFERDISHAPDLSNDSGWAWKGILMARKDLGDVAPVVAASYASNGVKGRADLKVRNGHNETAAKDGSINVNDIFDYQDRVWDLSPVIYQKLERVGQTFTQSVSDDGVTWRVLKTYVDEYHVMDGILFIGPAISSIDLTRQLGAYKVTMVKVTSGSGSGAVFVR